MDDEESAPPNFRLRIPPLRLPLADSGRNDI